MIEVSQLRLKRGVSSKQCYVYNCEKEAKYVEDLERINGHFYRFFCCEDHYLKNPQDFPHLKVSLQLLKEAQPK